MPKNHIHELASCRLHLIRREAYSELRRPSYVASVGDFEFDLRELITSFRFRRYRQSCCNKLVKVEVVRVLC